ncbi:outer membrane protein [Bartonella sp. B10]
MNTKCLIAASIFAFVLPSMVYAADQVIPSGSEYVVSPVISSSAFSWTGFYFGGQVGSFSSKISAVTRDVEVPLFRDKMNEKWVPMEEKYLPKLSGFVSGLYAGANIDFGNDLIFGVDTDVLLSGRKGIKTVVVDNAEAGEVNGRLGQKLEKKGDNITFTHTIKQKWSGATRLRVGFPAAYAMYYISGGVAYGQLQDILSTTITGEASFNDVSDDTKMMVGYTVGGGMDFAMTNNVILRTEYRYSDFGKKKFGDEVELDYKINDFRVGLAYKF